MRFQSLDRAAFLAHGSLAHQLDAGERDEPARTLPVPHGHAGLLRGMLGEQARLQAILQFLSGNPNLEERRSTIPSVGQRRETDATTTADECAGFKLLVG